MRNVIRLSIVSILVLASGPVLAAPHLGMKLACKEYGEAWRSGSRARLMATVTPDFAVAWQRVPDETFASLPRNTGGQVLATRKYSGSGAVTVLTGEGSVEFLVVGRGFNWKVADVRRLDREGQWMSVKESLHVSCAARDFITKFYQVEDAIGYQQAMSPRFASVSAAIPQASMTRVRRCLPKGNTASIPDIRFHGGGATMTVPVATDQNIAFHLVKVSAAAGDWRVDDVTFATPSLAVESLRGSLGALAAVADFGAFVKKEDSPPVEQFIADGDLRTELRWLESQGWAFPGARSGPPRRIEATRDGRAVHLVFDHRELHFHLTTGEAKAIVNIDILRGGSTNDLASLLARSRKLDQFASDGVIGAVLGYVFTSGD